MQGTGLLVNSWPIVLGCDASGIVTALGPKIHSLKVGDRISGCTRLGHVGYSTFQEHFLFDERFAILPPSSLSFAQGATIGVGTKTACIGLLQGIGLALPEDAKSPLKTGKEEWVVVLGGAGSVGQYAVQIAKALGYKVVATCSKRTADLVNSLGADEVVDYSQDERAQLEEIKTKTDGNFFGVYGTWFSILAHHGSPFSVTLHDTMLLSQIKNPSDFIVLEHLDTDDLLLQRRHSSEIRTFRPQTRNRSLYFQEAEGLCYD